MKKLAFYTTAIIDELAWPENEYELSENSPASAVFTDFHDHKPLVIDPDTSAVDAEKLMQKAHVRLKFVVNKHNHFLGILSLEDLTDQALIKKLSEGFTREELYVTDFMRPRNQLVAFDYAEISKAKISDVINALQGSGHQHCLVIDREQHKIRGIFSSSDIARMLKLPINIENKSSFSHIFSIINPSTHA